jgi:hypothetical protein
VPKLLHFAEVNQLTKIRSHGLRMSNAKWRAQGIYCIPCVALEPRAAKMWLRQLHERKLIRPRAAVVFEIPDDEMIHVFADWVDNVAGDRTLMPARQAETVIHQLVQSTRELNQLVDQVGSNKSFAKFPGWVVMEVVVPRPILASEVVSITLPGKFRKSKDERARRKTSDAKLILEELS